MITRRLTIEENKKYLDASGNQFLNKLIAEIATCTILVKNDDISNMYINNLPEMYINNLPEYCKNFIIRQRNQAHLHLRTHNDINANHIVNYLCIYNDIKDHNEEVKKYNQDPQLKDPKQTMNFDNIQFYYIQK